MHIELRGREYTVEDRLPNGDLRARDIATDELTPLPEAKLVDALFEGQLIFLGDGRANSAERKVAESFVGDFNMLEDGDARKKEAVRRWAYVKAALAGGLTETNASTLKPIIERVHAEIQDQGAPPSWKTVWYHWVVPYLECGEDVRALVPNFRKRGNTGRRFTGARKEPGQKYSEKEKELAREVAEVIDEVINEEYLNPQRLTVQAVYDRLEARIAEKNQLRDPDDQLPIPHRSSLYNIVSKLDEYEKDRARYGKRYADQKHRCVHQSPQPTRPLERTEIDHTRLDLFVVDEETRMPLGRPTLTTLLDKFTREVLGINVGFDPPSYLSVMRCLNHAIKPKTYVKTEFPEVKNDWEAYGIPEVIVVDNGREFRGKDFEDACLQLGIVVMYSPPYVPRYKGAIERFFGTENRRLLHQQSGTTFSNAFERHGYDPQKNAVISFGAFMKMLHVWIVDVYHQSYHRGLKDIPALVWREEIRHYPPALPRRAEDLRVLLGHIEHRVIGPSGIELFTLFYRCEELAGLRCQARTKDKVVVKYDPADLSAIYVYDSQADRYIVAPAVDQEYTKGLSLWQHRVVQRKARRDAKGRMDVNALRDAKRAIQEIVKMEMAKKGQIGAKSKAARWESVRQPNYGDFLDVPGSPDATLIERANPEAVPINPEAAPFGGISEPPIAALGGGDEGVVDQHATGVIDLAAETKRRKRKKPVSAGINGDGLGHSTPDGSPGGAEPTTWAADAEDLDMSGFTASYNLPGKESKYEHQAS
jgi:putative transposase